MLYQLSTTVATSERPQFSPGIVDLSVSLSLSFALLGDIYKDLHLIKQELRASAFIASVSQIGDVLHLIIFEKRYTFRSQMSVAY